MDKDEFVVLIPADQNSTRTVDLNNWDVVSAAHLGACYRQDMTREAFSDWMDNFITSNDTRRFYVERM